MLLLGLKRIASLILVLIVSTWCQAAPINELVTKRLAMGDKPNRLIHEKSPYLLQHAFNPVDWYPWGDEAFKKAKAEGRPIFLSVGYSTCHWCHVMEEESFESPEIAWDLRGDRPQGRMIAWIFSTSALAIFCGVSASRNNSGVTWLTRTSVHWALNKTAISNVNGSLWSRGIGGLG